MHKVELLSPAKNFETAICAINSGADAIYIGASDFGARQNASNSLENIEKLVNYAHKFYVRVHVTINTILNDSELDLAIELINKLYKIGVDAIIVQDMGILNYAAKAKLPPIQIHASTQCDNRTLEKVKFFDKIGVSRVILAREKSIKEIEEICKSVSCEIETFIHGALCVSYSGQCYLSFANGGRSANRGECAQPCRKKYCLVDNNDNIILKDKYLLSLKDFNASESIEKLINAGVKSFKIEGRLKDENYVKNVTLFYNNLINKYAKRTSSGVVITDFTPNVDKTFNRDYTDYFLKKRNKCFNFVSPKFMGEKLGKISFVGKNYFILDSELHPQDGICYIEDGKMLGCLINSVDKNKIYPNNMGKLAVGTIVFRNFDYEYSKALNSSKIQRKIRAQISVDKNLITAIDEDNNIVSLKMPIGSLPKNPEKLIDSYKKQLFKSGESDFCITNISINPDSLCFLPVSEINSLRRELLNLLMNKRLSNYRKLVQKPIEYAEFPCKKIDYRGNIFNKNAKEFYEACNCKVCEYALETSNDIKSGVELMRSKHCLKFALGKCKQNLGDLYLRDDKGKKYLLKFDCKNCEMIIINT
ncbi:U32 family peptidase [bacterium]|nr:U32 family peptidase [bacterium]